MSTEWDLVLLFFILELLAILNYDISFWVLPTSSSYVCISRASKQKARCIRRQHQASVRKKTLNLTKSRKTKRQARKIRRNRRRSWRKLYRAQVKAFYEDLFQQHVQHQGLSINTFVNPAVLYFWSGFLVWSSLPHALDG